MTRYVIALNVLGIKNNNIIHILESHSSDVIAMFEDRSIFDVHFDLAGYYDVFSNKEFVDEALAKADAILYRNGELGIKTTYYTAASYPKQLAQIDNPPAIIYYKGAEFADISDKTIACVGTRKPTRLSYNATNYLIPQWVKEGCAIISGLACGVDKISHQACISANGKTVAVLAHGLDMIYPKENSSLADRILESGGILMSEYPIGTKADKYRFVNRNRLIVGMSKAVIIYECDINGGTMHNVEHASKQHKPIFCPAIDEVVSEIQKGTKKLLDEKIAIEIKQGRDIEGVLNAVGIAAKKTMPNNAIKLNYLHSILSIINEPLVLEVTLRELNLKISHTSDIYDVLVEWITCGFLNIDEVIKLLVDNNIASIEKTLVFTD